MAAPTLSPSLPHWAPENKSADWSQSRWQIGRRLRLLYFLFSYSPSLKSDGKVAVPAAQTRLPSDTIIREFVDKIIKGVSSVVEFVCVSVCFDYEIL